MQIELIGCTSAGKSRLTQEILQKFSSNGFHLMTSYDFVLSWAHLGWIANHRLRMLFLNLAALSACLLTWRKNLAFYRFVLGVIRRLPAQVGPYEKTRIARIIARNIGIYELVCRYASDRQVILADEGTLHIAHYLFVHIAVEPEMSDLENFVRLVSLPDVAVYLRQPEAVLTARARTRRHRRIPGNTAALVNRFIRHGFVVFERLTAYSSLEGRLLVVNGQEGIEARGQPENPSLALAGKIIASGLNLLSPVTVEEIA